MSRARKGKDASDPLIGGAELKPHQYDVFINHRGPDVKKTFVAHLDDALRRAGYRPFLDAKDIGKGRHVFKSIDKALKGACVHVAIFSERYAESKYCLNELCEMLKSEQVILPIFYHVNAEDLRWIKNGPFKEGFEKHVKRGRIKEVEKWKVALRKVADYRGLGLDEVNGNEMELIRRILEEVRSGMPTTLLLAKQCYGMEKSMKDVLKTLESVSVLGLFGMGGIGKTTLAMEIYNHFVSCRQFDRYCFLKDVRSSEPSQLQHDLLKDLGHGSELQSLRPQDYKHAFDALISQKVLVVVDDIDDSSQFEALIPDIRKFRSGSRIVITSRQLDVLKRAMAGAPSQEAYDVPLLNESDSRRLFNHHAFLSETSSDGFAELATKVADACGGHALLLESIGASLFGVKDREVWSDAMKSVQENKFFFGKLRSTYDRLPTDGDRAMFRDIARLLMDGSLVKVDDRGRLRMHDVLRDMGRDFVKEEAQGSEEWTHLWDPVSAAKALGYKKASDNVLFRGLQSPKAKDKRLGAPIIMANYLQRSKKVLQDMQSFHVILNVEQCEFLRTKLMDTLLEVDRLRFCPFWSERFDHFLTKFFVGGDGYCASLSPQAFEEDTFNVVKRAEWLVSECCSEHWLLKAMEFHATTEISEILRSLADVLLPYALSVELGINPCHDPCWDAIRNLAEGVWGELVEVELMERSRSDRRALLSKVERILGKVEASRDMDFGIAHLVRDRYSWCFESSNWLPPEMASNIYGEVRGARVYTRLACFGGEYSLLTLNPDCGSISVKDEVRQEATLWKKYEHPFIVRFMGYWEVESIPYLMYEHMDFSLEKLITKLKVAPLVKVIEMMLPVAKAIRYIHEAHGVAHRHLHTENIVCTLMDSSVPLHGVSLKLMPGFGEGMAFISEFTAPEILTTKKINFMKADVFSFGVVVLKVLTGQTNLDVLVNSDGPKQLPGSMRRLIQSMCHADPNLRPSFHSICTRLLLCKLQLLSQYEKNVKSVYAPNRWIMCYDVILSWIHFLVSKILHRFTSAATGKNDRPLNDSVVDVEESQVVLRLLKGLQWIAFFAAMVMSSYLSHWILQHIVLFCLLITGFYLNGLEAEIEVHPTSTLQQPDQARPVLSMVGERSFESFRFDRVGLIKTMLQPAWRTSIGTVTQVMSRGLAIDDIEMERLRNEILQYRVHMPMLTGPRCRMMNPHQCQHLCDYVAGTQTMLNNLGDQGKIKFPNHNLVFKELLSVFKAAKLLVDGCRILKWSPNAIILVHCEEWFLKVYSELHLWIKVVKALCGEVLDSDEMAKEILGFMEAAANDHKMNLDVLRNHEKRGLDIAELDMVFYLQRVASQATVVHKSWRPQSFKPDIVIDLTEDLLGVSSTGWVIKTMWAGSYHALKRVNEYHANQHYFAPVLASLWHPHIVQLRHYWEEKGKLFMLMEYMESGDLANFITKKAMTGLPLHVVLDMLLQIAQGVYYLHSQGIAHNDLKCTNILMTPDPNREGSYIVKLGGFGSAKRIMVPSQPGDAFEQDIYNFGSICNECIADLEESLSGHQGSYDPRAGQYMRLCIKMCQMEDPVHRPNCAKLLRLLSLAHLQSLGIIIHTNEFHCWCGNGALNDLDKLVEQSMEESINETTEGPAPWEEPAAVQLVEEPSSDVPGLLNKTSLGNDHQEPGRSRGLKRSRSYPPTMRFINSSRDPVTTRFCSQEILMVAAENSALKESASSPVLSPSSSDGKGVMRQDGGTDFGDQETQSLLFACNPRVVASGTVQDPLGSIVNVQQLSPFELDQTKHKIFLSHAGAQKNFVEQLCVDLEARGYFFPFFDQRHHSLPKGKDFVPLIKQAAQLCHVAVIVLSEEFLCSKWPMIELAEFYVAKQGGNDGMNMLPLYYKLSVGDLDDWSIEDHWMPKWNELASTDKRIDVTQWTMAVRALRGVNGLSFGKNTSSEVGYRKEIVQSIWKLSPRDLLYDSAQEMVGYHRICQRVPNRFVGGTRVGASVLGLYGTSGLGKTTLSKALCNYSTREFMGRVCHLELGITTKMKRQELMLKTLCGIEEKVLKRLIDDRQGLMLMRDCMKQEPVFLVIDNVTNDESSRKEAHEYLMVGFHPKSKIMITARSKEVLQDLLPGVKFCMSIPRLNEEEAGRIFLKSVAPMMCFSSLTNEERRIVGLCIRKCVIEEGIDECLDEVENPDKVLNVFRSYEAYHPLALSAIGDFFYKSSFNTKMLHWKDSLEEDKEWRRDVFQDIRIRSIIWLQFSTLSSIEQLLFLDIALYSSAPSNAWGDYQGLMGPFEVWVEWLSALHGESASVIKRHLRELKRSGVIDWYDESACDFWFRVHLLYKEFAMWYVTQHGVSPFKEIGAKGTGSTPTWKATELWVTTLFEGALYGLQ